MHGLNVEDVEERGEEEEELVTSQHVTETHAASRAERDVKLGLHNATFGVEESRGVKLFWLRPERGVHVHGVDEWDHLGVLWYEEAVQHHVTTGANNVALSINLRGNF